MNTGRLAGTGKFVILPVDQGFEHGPAPASPPNPAGYDPRYHFELAIEAGCNAYAAPLGFIEPGASDFAGDIPLILKINNQRLPEQRTEPCSAITGSVEDALRLGCAAIGYTIYPGSGARNEHVRGPSRTVLEAKAVGLPRSSLVLSPGLGPPRRARPPWMSRATPRRSPPSWAPTSSR